MEERLAMKRTTMRQNMKNKSEIIASNRKRLLNNDTSFAIREAYVKLRTGLMFCMTKDRDRACKTIAVTSANPSEGKSLTAANIAISYAMLGKKTLLIDADLRKPTQRRLWKLDVSSGLCDFIAGIWKLELVKVKDLPLWIIGAGTIPPNPSELLSSDRMKTFVAEIATRYDYVIIDTPPINTVADARGDSCMILTLGKKDGSVKLASLERGTGVPILEGQYEGEYDWLTHTFRYGGADLMMREVRECFKVDVDRYIRVNFATFVQGIESVGGVDISLTEAEAAYINKFNKGGITCVAGQNHLDGRAALEYARCRKIDSDWQRVKRQRNVIQAAVNSTKDLSISELNDLMNQVFPLVQTNLSKLEITELLMLAPKCRGASIQQITIPIKDSYGGMTGLGGRSLFSVDFDTNAQALREFMYGENSDS